MVERDSKHQATVDKTIAKIQYAGGDLQRAQNRVRREVAAARAAGATWAEIGRALGITGQGAQKRYGNSEERVQARELELRSSQVKRLTRRLNSVATD